MRCIGKERYIRYKPRYFISLTSIAKDFKHLCDTDDSQFEQVITFLCPIKTS